MVYIGAMNYTPVTRPQEAAPQGWRVLSARVPEQLEEQASALAAVRGMTRSAWLRHLVENAVALDQEVRAA